LEELQNFTKIGVIMTPDDEDPATLTYIPQPISSFEYQLQHRLTCAS